MATRQTALTGSQILEYVGVSPDDHAVIKRPLPFVGHRVGDIVPLIDRSPEPPVFKLGPVEYPAVPFIRTIKSGDPQYLDRALYSRLPLAVRAVKRAKVSARDMHILELAKEGRTYAEIGDLVGGIKRQRVKQILDRLAVLGLGETSTRQTRKAILDELTQTARDATRAPFTRAEINADSIYHALGVARRRAQDRGLPFNLTAADVLPLPTHCPVLGMPLHYDRGRGRGVTDDSPSLDRITPELGYVSGNVLVISQRANRIKNDATVAELQKIAAFYADLAANTIDKNT